MRTSHVVFLIMISTLFIISCCPQEKEKAGGLPAGPFAGSPLPGNTPKLFAPGFITTGLFERDVAISPGDANEIYFSVFLGDWTTIMVTRNSAKGWTLPEVASFARDTTANFCEPAFSPDGKHLLFLSTLPPAGGAQKPGWQEENIWMVTRDEQGGWTDRKPLPHEINREAQFFPSIAATGDFYFCRTDTATDITSIYHTTWPLADPPVVEKLPAPVNDAGVIYNACISPDGNCMVGCATGRKPGQPVDRASYYAFFRKDTGWTDGVLLDSILLLSGANAISPSFSPDGKFFFFASNKRRAGTYFSDRKPDMDFFQERRRMPGNGNPDIYWIDAAAILDLNK